MAIKQQIQDDLKTAMLSGDSFAKDVLRGLKSVILNEEVAQGKRESGLDDTVIETLFAREVKKRNESAVLYDQGGNTAAAQKERAEAEMIKQYLPEQLSEAEVREIITAIVAEMGVSGPQAMGPVIGKAKSHIGNRAEGAVVAGIVKEIVNS